MPGARSPLAALLLLALPAALAAAAPPGDRTPSEVRDLAVGPPGARVLAETALIDFGTAGARPHLLGGWSVDEESEGRTLVWSLGESSELEFYLAAARPLTAVLRGQPLVEGWRRQRVGVRLNGEEIGRLGLWPWMWSYRLPLPASHLRAGLNRLELVYAYTVEPRALDPLSLDSRPVAVWWDWLRLEGARPPTTGVRWALGEEGGEVEIPPGVRIDHFLRLPPGTRLVIDAVEVRGGAPAEAPRLAVEVAADQGALRRFELPPGAGVDLELEPGGEPAIRRLSWRLHSGGEDGARLRLLRPRLVAPVAAQPGAAPRPDPRPPGPRPNLLVYLIDTLRADEVRTRDGPAAAAPRLAALAASAIEFDRAWAPSSWTRASVASLFTGLQAWNHGVNQRLRALPAEARTLAEILGGEGWATAAFVTNGNVSAGFGFDQGFTVFEHLREKRDREVHVQSDRLHARALDWLHRRPRDRPFFLYLHSTDPHGPYTPPEELRLRLAPHADTRLGELRVLRWLGERLYPRPERLAERLRALYRAEVAANDARLGELLDHLRELELFETTLLVVLSDHGEEFHDHGGWEHGQTLYEEQTHVPLLVRLPGGRSGGRRIDRPVQLVDLHPTLLELLGIDGESPGDGVSLRPLIAPDPAPGGDPRPVFSYLDLDGRILQAVRWGRFKLVRTLQHPRSAAPPLLFDLAADPGERHDLSRRLPVTTGWLLALLREAGADRPRQAPETVVDPDLEERLRALGYLQ